MAPTALAAPSREDASLAAPGALALRRLAQLIAAYAPHDGGFPLRLPGTHAIRFSRMSSEPMYATVSPCVCIVAQGAKAVMLGSGMDRRRAPAGVCEFRVARRGGAGVSSESSVAGDEQKGRFVA